MAADDAAQREVLASRLRDAGWVYISWDTLNAAWQFQGDDGSRRAIAAESAAEAMRLLLKQRAARDARDA